MAMTTAERVRKFRERRAALGQHTVTMQVPAHLVPGLHAILHAAMSRGQEVEWAACPLRDVKTGRLVRVRS